MAHNIANINGQAAMAFVGLTPWHGLGTKMPAGMTVEQALQAAQLNWTVRTEPLYLEDGRKAPRVAIVREDGTILGTASERYTPIQNTDAFGVLSEACEKHGLTVKTAGALGNGEHVWMLASLPATLTIPAVGGDDPVNGYLLVDTAHDGTGADNNRFTPIRVVCQNTLGAATNGSRATIKIRHTKNSAQRVREASRLVEQAIAAAKQIGDTFAKLARRNMTEAELRAYVASVFPAPQNDESLLTPTLKHRRAVVEHLVHTGRGHELSGMTAWGAYNAVAEYLDHVRPREAASLSAIRKAQTSALFGSGASIKDLALVRARQLVAA